MMPKSVVGDLKNLPEAGRTSNLSLQISKISRRSIGGKICRRRYPHIAPPFPQWHVAWCRSARFVLADQLISDKLYNSLNNRHRESMTSHFYLPNHVCDIYISRINNQLMKRLYDVTTDAQIIGQWPWPMCNCHRLQIMTGVHGVRTWFISL